MENPEPAQVLSFKYDKTKDGWKLLEDVPFNGQQFIPDIVEFLRGISISKSKSKSKSKSI